MSNRSWLSELQRVPFGERVRALRREKGVRSQAALLGLLEQRAGAKLSAAWLSGIESGALEPTLQRRQDLIQALDLSEDEAELLLAPEEARVAPDHELQSYAAWQSVRLVMSDELIRQRSSATERARGRAVRDRLREALTNNEEIWRASGNQVGALAPFADLPLSTRWLLALEAAYMQPFLPHQPFDEDWGHFRDVAVERIAEELGIKPSEDQLRLIAEVRTPSAFGRGATRWWQDQEPKAVVPIAPSSILAARELADVDGDSRLVRGESTVGELGWWAACGRYALGDVEDESASPRSGATAGVFALPVAALATPWFSGTGGGLGIPALVKDAISRERLRRADARGGAQGDYGTPATAHSRAVAVVAAMDRQRLKNDLAKLISAVRLRVIDTNSWGNGPDALPGLNASIDGLHAAARALKALHQTLASFDADSSPRRRAAEDNANAIERAAKTLLDLHG